MKKSYLVLLFVLMALTATLWGQFKNSQFQNLPFTTAPHPSDVFILGVPSVTNQNIYASNLLNTAIMKGTPKQVLTTTDRDALSSTIRVEGMTCYVINEAKTYQLQGGILNANWVDVTPSVSATTPSYHAVSTVGAATGPDIQDTSNLFERGYYFIASQNIVVKTVGRYVLSGNSGTHYGIVRDVTGCSSLGQTPVIPTIGATTNAFASAVLPSGGVLCLAGHRYFVAAHENVFGDYFSQVRPLTMNSIITNIIGAYNAGGICTSNISWVGEGYPIDFTFELYGGTSSGTVLQPGSITLDNLTLSTNLFGSIAGATNFVNEDLGEQLMEYPWSGVANWLDYYNLTNAAYGNHAMGEPGADIATNSINWLAAYGQKLLRIDRGWAATNRTVDGFIQPNAQKFPDMPGLVAYAHSKNIRVSLTLDYATSLNTVGGGTIDVPQGGYASIEQIAADTKEMARWGIDELCFLSDSTWTLDPATSLPTLDQTRVIYRTLWQAAVDAFNRSAIGAPVKRGLVLTTGVTFHMGSTHSNWSRVPDGELVFNQLFTQEGLNYDAISSTRTVQQWAITNFLAWSQYIRPGHYTHANGSIGSPQTVASDPVSQWRQFVELMAITETGYYYTLGYASNATFAQWITNKFFNQFRDDPASVCGSMVYSNLDSIVFKKPVGPVRGRSSSENLVVLSNGKLSSTNFTMDVNLLGLKSNVVYQAVHAWYGTNLFTFTNAVGGLTVAANESKCYYIYPQPHFETLTVNSLILPAGTYLQPDLWAPTNNAFDGYALTYDHGTNKFTGAPQVKAAFSTNGYHCTMNDNLLFCTGTNQLVFLINCTNATTVVGKPITIVVASTTGSVIVTNENGVQTVAGDLSFTLISTNSRTFYNNGANWW